MKYFSVVSYNDIIDLIIQKYLPSIHRKISCKQINSYGFRKHLLMSIHFFTERDYIYIVTAIFDKTDIPPTGYV